jgi:hypothetical protein
MTPSIEELERLVKEATPGPWFAGYWSGSCHKPEHSGTRHPGPGGDNGCVYDYELSAYGNFRCYVSAGTKEAPNSLIGSDDYGPVLTEANAALIVAAVNSLPSLIQENKRLREALEPFAKAWDILAALPPDLQPEPETGVRDVLPRLWPTVIDLERARAALRAERE